RNASTTIARMKSPDCNPRWARSPWTTNCCPPRSPPWRPKALWPEGGRDDEPDGLAFHVAFLWPGAGAPIVCDSLRHESRTLRFPGGYDRPGQHPDKGLSDRGDGGSQARSFACENDTRRR